MLSALVPSQPGEKVISYPARPVDTSTDFDGTNTAQTSQVSSGIAVSGSVTAGAVAAVRPLPPSMQMVSMQRMQNTNMASLNFGAQASMAGTNPNLPLHRGPQQAHQQVRRKEPSTGFQNTGYQPPQPKRRF
ncbi:hypothetical protein KI387_042693 [Taxus chinensis]|uniref:Uncharacterized protein n=1 Tax=Taxus chinensis TaxID=29808 RepID=A0AA38F8B0_TAXCH|nr:hypothetical protein KI387_042693 [Taxus chinensis]